MFARYVTQFFRPFFAVLASFVIPVTCWWRLRSQKLVQAFILLLLAFFYVIWFRKWCARNGACGIIVFCGRGDWDRMCVLGFLI